VTSRELPVISLFSGAMGLDLGMERAGFTVRVAVENNAHAAATIRRNRPDVKVIERSIEKVSTREILKAAGLKVGEAALVVGGPSCVSFSTAGQRGSFDDPRGQLFRHFIRVVREARPRFFVMENVRGILSAAVKHRPLKQRGPGYPLLSAQEELGSALLRIIRTLQRTGYFTVFDILNAADFGVPQLRERAVFIGSRDGHRVHMPEPTHSESGEGGLRSWVTVREALGDLQDREPAYRPFSESKLRYMRQVPEGGNWRDLPRRLQKQALGGAMTSWGGRNGFFRRLSWDRPAPALTSRPDSKATMQCHPSEDRPLTLREYTRLQQFPDNWIFEGSLAHKYLQAGNAVPVGLATAVGAAVRSAMRSRRESSRLGTVDCATPELITRLAGRPRTVVNPPRMRRYKRIKSLKKWLDRHGDSSRARSALLKALRIDRLAKAA